jgi:hypothetical protein
VLSAELKAQKFPVLYNAPETILGRRLIFSKLSRQLHQAAEVITTTIMIRVPLLSLWERGQG